MSESASGVAEVSSPREPYVARPLLGEVVVARTPADVARLAARCSAADRVAADVESNGLYAFRSALCMLQLAWHEDDGIVVAIVDTLAVRVDALRAMFGGDGPVKVLHDLSFDARLLAEAEAPLARVRDTSVAARFLGYTSTGLASLLASELGVTIDKRFQQHDWSRRPLLPEHVEYLAGDVLHLLALDDHFAKLAEAVDLAAEIDDECAYKLASAKDPPRDPRPAYVKIKGASALDAVGRAVLRQLCQAREQAAERADVPPFKVIGNDTLLELARIRPSSSSELRAVRGAAVGRAAGLTSAWLRAILAGVRDGEVPADEQSLFQPARPDREMLAKRRARETQVSSWRRAEAKRRGVDEQAVLPGHCATDLVDALAARDDALAAGNERARDLDASIDATLRDAIARISGMGARRIDRYADVFLALAREPPTKAAPAAAPPAAPPSVP